MASLNDILGGISVGKRDGEDDIYSKPDNSPSPSSSAEAEGLNKNNTNTDGGKTGVQSTAQAQVINKAPVIDKTSVTVDSPATNLATVENDGGDALEHGERVDVGSSSESVADNRGEQMGFYEKFFRENNPYRVETDEEREKREKKEKREGVISGIGNALSAFANLYFATKGAPSINPEVFEKMSAQNRERWERLARERKENERAWYETLTRAKRQDYEDAWREKQYQHTLEREKKSDEYRDAKEKRDADKAERQEALDNAKLALTYGKLTHQGYMNYIAQVKAGKIEELTQAQINKLNRMGTGGGDSQENWGTWYAYDKDGNLHSFKAKNGPHAKNTADGNNWKLANPDESNTTTRTEQTPLGKKTTTTTKTSTSKVSKKPKAEKGKNTKKLGL